MNLSMIHWNGCQLCVIDIETTGDKPGWHEIWEICILPLDSNIQIRRDVRPFNITMKPYNPERIDYESEVMRGNKQRILEAGLHGFDQEKAKDLLSDWIDKLGLPLNKGGYNRCKVIALGHNFAFDKAFMVNWLGQYQYDEWFHWHYRDTMASALYLNDRAGMHCQNVPFPKVNLTYVAKCLNVNREGLAHCALSDCMVTAEIYRLMVNQGLLG